MSKRVRYMQRRVVVTGLYITIYTKEEGKQELTQNQWYDTDTDTLIYHREDGPAREWTDGDKHWYINGKLHREDGPAIDYRPQSPRVPDASRDPGFKRWYIAGEEYFETEYNKLLKEVDSLEPILGLIDPREWVRKRFERKYKDKI